MKSRWSKPIATARSTPSNNSRVSFLCTCADGSAPFARRYSMIIGCSDCGLASMPAEPTMSRISGPSLAFSAYSAVTLRNTLPVQMNKTDFMRAILPEPSLFNTTPGTMAAMKTNAQPAGKLTVETEKLQTRLCRLAGQAIADYSMIEDGD